MIPLQSDHRLREAVLQVVQDLGTHVLIVARRLSKRRNQ